MKNLITTNASFFPRWIIMILLAFPRISFVMAEDLFKPIEMQHHITLEWKQDDEEEIQRNNTIPFIFAQQSQQCIQIDTSEDVEAYILDRSNKTLISDHIDANSVKDNVIDISILRKGKYTLCIVGEDGEWIGHFTI